MADKNLERSPFAALPYVYFKDTRNLYRTIRKVYKPGEFVDLDMLRAATESDGRGPMPDATFREYLFALTTLGFVEIRRNLGGRDEGALTTLGDRINRTPDVDTGALMAEWKPILDRFVLPVIDPERAYHLLSATELDKRFDVLQVPVGRRRARFFHAFYPIYAALEKGAIDEFLELLQTIPDGAPRRVQRQSAAASILESPAQAVESDHVAAPLLVPALAPTPAPFLPVMVPLGQCVEYHRDGRLFFRPLP